MRDGKVVSRVRQKALLEFAFCKSMWERDVSRPEATRAKPLPLASKTNTCGDVKDKNARGVCAWN